MTKREKADKLHLMFRNRFDEIKCYGGFGYSAGVKGIDEYMERLKPDVIMVRCVHLVSVINNDFVDSIAVRNPYDGDKAIVMDAGYADKILVLGLPRIKKIELGLIGLGFATLLFLTPFLNEIHKKNIESLREPPVFRIEEHPRLQAHCKTCERCREMVYNPEKPTPPICDIGMGLMVEDVKERWGK